MAMRIDSTLQSLPGRVQESIKDDVASGRRSPYSEVAIPLNAALIARQERIDSQRAQIKSLEATLQSQAERIAELERESETHSKAYGLAIVERDNLRHELETAQEGWRCECSTDDACRFARERDALRAELGDLPEAQAEMLAEIKQLRAQLAEIGEAEPVAWFAFADSNGPIPLELFGWDEKACKHAVLTYARAGNWKGTVEGYLLQQGWTLKPLFTRPMPAQNVTELVDALESTEKHLTAYLEAIGPLASNGGRTETLLIKINAALANAKGAK